MRFAQHGADAALPCRISSPSLGEGEGVGDRLTRFFPHLYPPPRGGRSDREPWAREGNIMTHARMWVGAVVVVGLLGVLGLFGSQERAVGVAGADSAVKKVKCDEGQTLTDALKTAKPGDTLKVTGTCQERE
jgi:hypothetical protein